MFNKLTRDKHTFFQLVALLLASLFLAACSDQEATGDGSEPADLPPVAVVRAREALATELNIDVSQVAIDDYERAEWGDSCLGLGGPAESCLTAIHPGWLVMLDVDGQIYEVRTDELGDIIRIKQ